MDKEKFQYTIDLNPINHVYYYLTFTSFTLLSDETVDFNYTLHMLFNALRIIYKNVDLFGMISFTFYKNIFKVIKVIYANKNNAIFVKHLKKGSQGEIQLNQKLKEESVN